MLAVASRVPDHGRLEPWRYVIFEGEARDRAGQLVAQRLNERDGPLDPQTLAREEARFNRAPLVIGVVSVPKEHERIPEWEQFLSGGASAMLLVLAAEALGYGANWITNWYSDDAEARRLLGLAPEERMIGFVHIGTPAQEVPDRPRPDLTEIVSRFAGPFEP